MNEIDSRIHCPGSGEELSIKIASDGTVQLSGKLVALTVKDWIELISLIQRSGVEPPRSQV